VNGQIKVGLTDEEIILMSERDDIMKAGTREIALAVAAKRWAATTVSATIRIASAHGIKVFATGGIGGVHDVSNWVVELVAFTTSLIGMFPRTFMSCLKVE